MPLATMMHDASRKPMIATAIIRVRARNAANLMAASPRRNHRSPLVVFVAGVRKPPWIAVFGAQSMAALVYNTLGDAAMPIHDWTRVRANRFHHFHQTWTANLTAVLNSVRLPAGYFAMAEQIAGGPEADVLALKVTPPTAPSPPGTSVAAAPPSARFIVRSEAGYYARSADRIAIRHTYGDVVAVIEIVSPGKKDSRHAIRAFARKAVAFLQAGNHLLIVDLFPPNRRNPHGIHPVIWERLRDKPLVLPPDNRLTLAAYAAGTEVVAYVEPVAVGDVLPDRPILLAPDSYVNCPLEATYEAAWGAFPAVLMAPLEPRANA
jgi:hypothetical protein